MMLHVFTDLFSIKQYLTFKLIIRLLVDLLFFYLKINLYPCCVCQLILFFYSRFFFFKKIIVIIFSNLETKPNV